MFSRKKERPNPLPLLSFSGSCTTPGNQQKETGTVVTLEMPAEAAEKLAELIRSGKAPQLEAEFPGIEIEIDSESEEDGSETR